MATSLPHAGSALAPNEREGEAYMKYPFLSLTLAAVLAVPALQAAAQPQTSTQTSKPAPATRARSAAVKTHVANADFVAYNAKDRTMTIKDEKGQTSTVSLGRTAIREIDQLHLKNGDHMILTFRDNTKGKRQAVTDIKLAHPSA